jgi:hypothetical protein
MRVSASKAAPQREHKKPPFKLNRFGSENRKRRCSKFLKMGKTDAFQAGAQAQLEKPFGQ